MTQPTDNRRVPGRQPRLLDLFCCQGGAGKGRRAGCTRGCRRTQHLGRAALAMLAPVLGVAA
jgi:hypothetical protein